MTVTDTATSVARTTSWTYNPQGLLATETGTEQCGRPEPMPTTATPFYGRPGAWVVDPEHECREPSPARRRRQRQHPLHRQQPGAPKPSPLPGVPVSARRKAGLAARPSYFNGSGSYLLDAGRCQPGRRAGRLHGGDLVLRRFGDDGPGHLPASTMPAVSVGADRPWASHHFGASLSGKVRAFIYSGADQYSVDSSGALDGKHLVPPRVCEEERCSCPVPQRRVAELGRTANVAPNTLTTGWSLFIGRFADSAPGM